MSQCGTTVSQVTLIQTLKIISWNVNHRAISWEHMTDFGADVVLLQESTPSGLPKVHDFIVVPPPTENWKIANAPKNGTSATASVIVNTSIGCEPGPYMFASHPGQFSIVHVPFGAKGLYLVSIYGILQDDFADGALHRALSDLAPIFESGADVLVAGDLNSFRGYSLSGSQQAIDRHAALFSRFEQFGLKDIGPFSSNGPLDNCPCNNRVDCTHVHTYRYMNREGERRFQNDYVFGTKGVQNSLVSCKALTDENPSLWELSDHAPIEVVLKLDSK